jgi:hypothetical protein
LTSYVDSTLNFEFRTSFCQYFICVIIFDLCHLFRKKAGLQGFNKKFITPEPLEINNGFCKSEFLTAWPICCAIGEIFLLILKNQLFISNGSGVINFLMKPCNPAFLRKRWHKSKMMTHIKYWQKDVLNSKFNVESTYEVKMGHFH